MYYINEDLIFLVNPLNELVINNIDVKSEGFSNILFIDGAVRVELLVSVGERVGLADIQFHVDVVEPNGEILIRRYSGNVISLGNISDVLLISDIVGSYIKVVWTGNLNDENYFKNVMCRVIAKR